MFPDILAIVGRIWLELALLGACGIILLGADDLLVDLLRLVSRPRCLPLTQNESMLSGRPARLAIFVPAWDEAKVIGPMLATCKARWPDENWVAFVGIYPNDTATRRAVTQHVDARTLVVVNERPGPTTKADCLNTLWHGMGRYEKASGLAFDAIVLHDAEDLVDPWELHVYRLGLDVADMVQIPVCPLPGRPFDLVAGHYLDEFAEAHGKDLVVRSAIGASLPSAGVGSAIRRTALEALAQTNAEGPFHSTSLTEDYELGLRLSALGHSSAFLRCTNPDNGTLVAVRAHFPNTLDAAARQKSRWIAGIALAGWDRLGWHGGPAEWWMRWRDRRSLLAALIIAVSYAALGLAVTLTAIGGSIAVPPFLADMLSLSALLLLWRLIGRSYWTWRAAGFLQAALSLPRAFISNMVAVMACRRALASYVEALQSGKSVWQKTDHRFPEVDLR